MSRGRRQAALGTLSDEVRGWQVDQEMFDAAVAELAGLKRTQWRCLDILSTRGPLTAGQLATASHLTTGAVTAVVDHLESAGLVRRVRDTIDRRRVIIETTDEMARRAEVVYGPLVAESGEVLSVFNVDELDVIAEFVRRERGLLIRHTARVQEMSTEGAARAGEGPASEGPASEGPASEGAAPSARSGARARGSR